MPRNHHLSEHENYWSKKTLSRKESSLEGRKVSLKLNLKVSTADICPSEASIDVPEASQCISCCCDLNEKIPETNASTIMSNYVMHKDTFCADVHTADMQPAKSVALNNIQRIDNVLKRVEETKYRSSTVYITNKFKENTESSRPNSPEISKPIFHAMKQPGPDGIMFGGKYNWLRPSNTSAKEEREKNIKDKKMRLKKQQQHQQQLQLQQQQEMKKYNTIDCIRTHIDPWPYFYRMSLNSPISQTAAHEKEWDASFIIDNSLSHMIVQPNVHRRIKSKILRQESNFLTIPLRPKEKSSKLFSNKVNGCNDLNTDSEQIDFFETSIPLKVKHDSKNENYDDNNGKNNGIVKKLLSCLNIFDFILRCTLGCTII